MDFTEYSPKISREQALAERELVKVGMVLSYDLVPAKKKNALFEVCGKTEVVSFGAEHAYGVTLKVIRDEDGYRVGDLIRVVGGGKFWIPEDKTNPRLLALLWPAK